MSYAPINVITVEREYGSRGGEFAHQLAVRLGWKLLDSDLVTAAAKSAGVSPELAAKFDERLDPWYYRYGKVFWHDSPYPMTGLGEDQVFDSERMLTLIKKEIARAAEAGNCVLVGRGAACALSCVPGCFHVFVYATMRAKREWFFDAFPNKAQQADQMLAETLKIAVRIADLSPVAVQFGKAAVNRAFETTLVEGVRHERALFLSLFGTPDQKEGMAAFIEKRKPAFDRG